MSIFEVDLTGGDTDREYKPDIVCEIPKEPAAKITDPFGEHIGGARKELWRGRGLTQTDVISMNSMERDKYIKKDNIWKKPDYMDMIREGRAVEVVYAIKKIRDSVMPAPISWYNADSFSSQSLSVVSYIISELGSYQEEKGNIGLYQK